MTLKDLPWELNNWKMDWKTPKLNGAVGRDPNGRATRIFCPRGLFIQNRPSRWQNENVRIYINSLKSLLHATHKRETLKPTEPMDLKWDHTALLCYRLLASWEHLILKSVKGG